MNMCMYWLLMATIAISPHLSKDGAVGLCAVWVCASIYYAIKGR